jgi:putative DNA methylase
MMEVPHGFIGDHPVNPEALSNESVWEGTRGLASDVESYGRWIQEEAKRRIGSFYPAVLAEDGSTANPIAWIWARSVKSPDPSWSGYVPLVRSWILSRKPGKPVVWVEPIVDRSSQRLTYHIRTGGTPLEGNVGRNGASCIATGAPIPLSYIRDEARGGRMKSVALATVVEVPRGRGFLSPSHHEIDADELPIPFDKVPSSRLPKGGLGFRVQNYGVEYWSQLFTPRQLLAITTLESLVEEVRKRVESDALAAGRSSDGTRLRDGGDGAVAYADAVVTYLSLAVSKALDFNCTVASWDSTNLKVRNTFARQAIPMTWDFAEANILGAGVGSFESMVASVSGALRSLPSGGVGHAAQRDARSRIRDVGTCVVSTDPPYYDNVGYADLSDFFYVWLRQMLGSTWPDECATRRVPAASARCPAMMVGSLTHRTDCWRFPSWPTRA